MNFSGLVVQLLNGLAGASSLFLVSAGLSLIFGVTRIVNFAHGSFYMLGIYVACWSSGWTGWASGPRCCCRAGGGRAGRAGRDAAAAPHLPRARAVPAAGHLRPGAGDQGRMLWLWGPEELLGPRAPGLKGAVAILGRNFPSYDLFLIAVGPIVLGLLWLLFTRTRWGTLVRAATQDREMVGALGVNQAWLFTAVFALGAALAGLGGALQLPREPANLEMDMNTIGAAFVVVVVGGMGSIPGAFVAALLVAEIKAVCIWLGLVHVGFDISFSKLTLVVEFLVMAVVLVVRPWGLMGKPQAAPRVMGEAEPLRRPGRWALAAAWCWRCWCCCPPAATPMPWCWPSTCWWRPCLPPACTSSWGRRHAFLRSCGLLRPGRLRRGAAGAQAGLPMEAALVLGPLAGALGALLVGWFCVRLSGVYLAMLTLAFAQIVGHRLSVGCLHRRQQRPDGRVACALVGRQASLLLPHPGGGAAGAVDVAALAVLALGYACARARLAAARRRHRHRRQTPAWAAFAIAGGFAGVAGRCSRFPRAASRPRRWAWASRWTAW
jgi:branched-chain amino acid transport system permease protein